MQGGPGRCLVRHRVVSLTWVSVREGGCFPQAGCGICWPPGPEAQATSLLSTFPGSPRLQESLQQVSNFSGQRNHRATY